MISISRVINGYMLYFQADNCGEFSDTVVTRYGRRG